MARKVFNREKIMVKQTTHPTDIKWRLHEGVSLDELGLAIHALKAQYGADAVLTVEYDGWDETIDCILVGERLETDEEHKRRVERYDRAQARKALKPKAPTAAEKRAAEKQQRIAEVIKEARKLGIGIIDPALM